MLLVLSNGGYLAPPDEKPELEDMWTETWKRVNRFLPSFLGELFPEEVGKPRRREKEEVLPVREKEGEGEKEGEEAEGEGEVKVEEKEG